MPDPIISIPWADDSMTVLDFNKVKVNGELAVDLLAERDKLRDLLSIAKAALGIFQGFNPAGPACPVCGTKANLETVLVPIPGTEKEHLVECRQVHVECFKSAHGTAPRS